MKKNGFTLIELLATLAVVTIILSFSLPSISNQKSIYLIIKHTNQIVAIAKSYQQRAIVEDASYKIAFISKAVSYPAKIEINKSINGNYQIIKTIEIPQSINISNRVYTFSTFGLPSPGGFGTVKLTCGKFSKYLIMSSSGRIRVQ